MKRSFSICTAGMRAIGRGDPGVAVVAARLVRKRLIYGIVTTVRRSRSVQRMKIVEPITTRSTTARLPFRHTRVSLCVATKHS